MNNYNEPWPRCRKYYIHPSAKLNLKPGAPVGTGDVEGPSEND